MRRATLAAGSDYRLLTGRFLMVLGSAEGTEVRSTERA
jgi:hypothetical protein